MRIAFVAVGAFLLSALAGAPVQAAPVTYVYTGQNFTFCGWGCGDFSTEVGDPNAAPANWMSDSITASLTFDEALPANMPFQDMYSSPHLLAWSLGDSLGYFSVSSGTGGTLAVAGSLAPSPLMLSTDGTGNIDLYLMARLLETAGSTDVAIMNPPFFCEECDDIFIADFFTYAYQTDAEWNSGVAGLTPEGLIGEWTIQETRTAVPEPATLTLMGVGLAAAAGRKLRGRKSSSR